MDAALTTSSLTVGYPRSGVVAGPLELTLRRGELTALIGANGCGKSTLLRTLCGAQAPLGGEVRLNGVSVAGMKPACLARSVSLVCTDRTVGGGLTVEQTVALGRQPHTGFFGRLDADDRRAVDEAMTAMGVVAMRLRHVAELSDGERQKTMIARALAQATPLIVLDEPTTFLDVASRLEVLSLLSSLAAEGTTILLSTHDVAETLPVADRLWLMSDGGMECGTPDALAASGALDRVFASRGVGFDQAARRFVRRDL